jgi:hypothetical protein
MQRNAKTEDRDSLSINFPQGEYILMLSLVCTTLSVLPSINRWRINLDKKSMFLKFDQEYIPNYEDL